MKLNGTLGLLLLAAATAGAGTALAAQATTTTSAATAATPAPAPAGKHWYHRHRAVLVRIMLRASRQLDLTAQQQQTIKGILTAARSPHAQAGSAPPLDLTVLANPGDPNYAAALQTVKSRAQSRLQKEIELQGQIYNVLTADQKARLPQVLADMKTSCLATPCRALGRHGHLGWRARLGW